MAKRGRQGATGNRAERGKRGKTGLTDFPADAEKLEQPGGEDRKESPVPLSVIPP